MAAAPLSVTADLHTRVATLRDEHAARWLATPAILPALGPPTGRWRQISTARAAAGLIDSLAGEAAQLAGDGSQQAAWRQSVRERLQGFGEARLRWPAGYRRLLFAEDFFAASKAFARAAHSFAPALPPEDSWQALRNVWIGNSLQLVLERPVTVGDGLFAYSMLYPLTDNLLDDPRLPDGAKREFVGRFGRRLAGLPERPANGLEEAVFRLVERIEGELPRRLHPDVHESLLAIHGAQVRSLQQQDGSVLVDDDLLEISCEKGGTSVLADLYLVAAGASDDEEHFAFGYGVFLQLLDDLQDVERDLAAGHHTLFTRAAGRGPLDVPTARLARFIDEVLDTTRLLAGATSSERKDLIRRNCLMLLVGAIAEQPRRFSRAFRRQLSRRWPLSLRALRRLRRRAQDRFGAAARALQRQTGAASLLDWALAQEEGHGARAEGGHRRDSAPMPGHTPSR